MLSSIHLVEVAIESDLWTTHHKFQTALGFCLYLLNQILENHTFLNSKLHICSPISLLCIMISFIIKNFCWFKRLSKCVVSHLGGLFQHFTPHQKLTPYLTRQPKYTWIFKKSQNMNYQFKYLIFWHSSMEWSNFACFLLTHLVVSH